MATPTYDLLASTSLDSATQSVTFTNIDQSYGDLVLVATWGPTANFSIRLWFNSSTNNGNYPYVAVANRNNSGNSLSGTEALFSTVIDTSLGNMAVINIMDYSATNKDKMIISRSAAPGGSGTPGTDLLARRWNSTAAVTTIEFNADQTTFLAGSTFSLYGIAK